MTKFCITKIFSMVLSYFDMVLKHFNWNFLVIRARADRILSASSILLADQIVIAPFEIHFLRYYQKAIKMLNLYLINKIKYCLFASRGLFSS